MSKRQHRKALDIGITQILNQTRSFSGFLKVRYSDFHVHEIDLTGRILHLTSSDLPPEETTVETLDQDSNLIKWISEETAKKINALQNALDITGTDRQCQKVEINVTSANKDIRTKIHRWIGQFDNLQSETIDHDSEKLISVFRTSISDKKRCLRRPYNQAKYTHCVLYKEGLDTTDAISYLSRKLRMQPKYITFAGTKDKQAKTVQRICFSNVDAKRLLAINQYSTHSKLGNFSYQPSHIRLGDLKGNHFKILIRQVQTTSSDEISKAVNSLGDRGFINYYGLQRFGTFKIPTHLVGKALLQMDWLKAFDLILQPTEDRDPSFLKKAKKLWLEHRDPVRAWKQIPTHHQSIESTLLHGLSKYFATKDFWAALKSLPRNMRTLYFHSYQSYLWNHIASWRMKEYGLNPVVGDMVYVNSDSECDFEMELEMEAVSTEVEEAKDSGVINLKKSAVKVLTEEELSNYSIYDIIIPLEGTEVKIPENSVLKPYHDQLLSAEGVIEGFPNFRPRSELPKGAYRKVVVLPSNVAHRVIPYNEDDNLDDLIPSDIDILQKNLSSSSSSTNTPPPLTTITTEAVKDKDQICVIVEFSLPSSSYATMALREILEERTSLNDDKSSSEAVPEIALKKAKLEENGSAE